MTAGTVTEAVSDGQADASRAVTDAAVSAPVCAVSGISDWSLQAFEQSPVGPGAHLDEVILSDLVKALDAEVDRLLLNGTGTGAQPLGLLNVSGANEITVAALKGAEGGGELFTELGKAMAAVGRERKRPPEAILMSTSRYAWFGVAEDSSKRPLLLNTNLEGLFPIGALVGLGVYLDDAIPRTLGTGGNQEAIVLWRPADCWLFESPVSFSVLPEVLSATMEVRFRAHAYLAFMAHRFPTSIAKVVGAGLVPATGF
jgi:HK97 family phage major capsid protein